MTGVRIGTAEPDSTFLSQGFALKTVLDRVPALAPVDVSTSAHASVENANRLQAGDIDFGFMASNWIGRAKNGEAPFTPAIDLRMAAPMNAGPLVLHRSRRLGATHGARPARPPPRRRAGEKRHGTACPR